MRTGKALQETLKQIEEEAWDLHDQIVESYVKNESGGSEDQSIGYDGNDQTAERGGNDSPGDRDSGGYLQKPR